MITGCICYYFFFVLCKTEELGITDEVVRMPVVLRMRNEIPDFVQDRCGFEVFAFGAAELMEVFSLVKNT